MIRVSMACGHPSLVVSDTGDQPPVCPVCDERRVSLVKAPAPTFRGAVRGPSAVNAPISGVAVSVAPRGPLTLKE